MKRRLHPAYVGMLVGWALIGLGVAYQQLCCDPREWLQQAPEPRAAHRVSRDGVTVEFEARPLHHGPLREGDFASIRFKVSEQGTGKPLSGMSPGAWLDPAQAAPPGAREGDCRARLALFNKSSLGARPLLDLSSYSLLMLNHDASLTVLDPTLKVGGAGATLARIELPGRPTDWVASADARLVFVSMPERNQVAVLDTDTFSGVLALDAGDQPQRLALQPDQRLLWVGNDASDPQRSGVTVIDVPSRTMLKSFATGAGHHEIAFSADSHFAFVSNREDGTLSVIDIAQMRLVRTLQVGPQPQALAYSALSQAVYVADARDGSIRVIDARRHQLRRMLQAEPGLRAMGFARDGRYAVVLDNRQHQALVIDASGDELIHRIPVAAEPYQLTFSKRYAYVRGQASAQVSMIELASLGHGRTPHVEAFEAGTAAPRAAGELPLAPGLSLAHDQQSVFVVNPVDNTTYHYAEGSAAPSSAYANRGHQAHAAMVIDRSLREVAPGVYGSTVRLPVAGIFDVALVLDQPPKVLCFSTEVAASPKGARFEEVRGPLGAGASAPLLAQRRVR